MKWVLLTDPQGRGCWGHSVNNAGKLFSNVCIAESLKCDFYGSTWGKLRHSNVGTLFPLVITPPSFSPNPFKTIFLPACFSPPSVFNDFSPPPDMSLSKFQEMVKDRKVWHAAVYGVSKNWTRLSAWTTTPPPSNFLPSALWHRPLVNRRHQPCMGTLEGYWSWQEDGGTVTPWDFIWSTGGSSRDCIKHPLHFWIMGSLGV